MAVRPEGGGRRGGRRRRQGGGGGSSGAADSRVFIFCNFIFFGFLFYRAGDKSTHTRKSDFHVHVKMTIFADPWVRASRPPTCKNRFSRHAKTFSCTRRKHKWDNRSTLHPIHRCMHAAGVNNFWDELSPFFCLHEAQSNQWMRYTS